MIKFSIIIPVRKIGEYVHEAIPHFNNQTYKNFEIIVISEADENVKFPKTKIIKVGQVPPAEKRNTGVINAKGEILAFIDDDAYPEKDWLEKALKDFEDKNIVAVGGPSLVPKNATFFQRVSNKVYELSATKTGDRYGKGKRKEIDDWPTCNFFVRKKDFDEVKGFDSKYWGGEDTQVCYSLLKQGKMIYDPELLIYHHPRKSLKQHLKQTFFWGMWRGFFMRIHKESRQLLFFIPALFVLGLFFGLIFSLFSKLIMYAYLVCLCLYGLFLLTIGIKTKSIKLFFPVMFLTFLTQISYALGFLKGILSKDGPIKKTLNPSEKLKI
ncbi:MAG: glycosyltransferase [Candidatus Nanoarchaeia archaeon]